ncbi:MAG: LytTR family DNA-binding domain-containing protein [Halieaceae bacterium]|jgi:two-component system LytT family response regulator|nr:LytTR family DNA-binding domain-containing protein [Halieaceae bacterium]
MNKLRTVIVDDEPLARRGLSLRLADRPDLELVAECGNGEEALKAVADHAPDLMFLDIQMPGMDGFDVVSHLQGDNMPLVIFATAFDQFAVDAFEVNAVDYVLKPVDDDRLEAAIERAVATFNREQLADQKQNLVSACMQLSGASAATVEEIAEGKADSYPDKLSIRDGDEVHMVPVEEIDWIDAAGDYMCVHAANVTHIMRITMKQLEALLNPLRFLRIHRSTIVNRDRISSAQSLTNGEYLLTLHEGTRLKVSRSYRDRIRELTALSTTA